jgi:hypothetical protein
MNRSSNTERHWVYTGHANGNITINGREADSVEREKARVLFQEEHRTVIGHYYWQMLVAERCEAECVRVFGVHLSPTDADAQKRFCEEGVMPHWKCSYVSACASMHPWEDFAETFATYLDMVGVLDTAKNLNVGGDVDPLAVDLPAMLDAYILQGIAQNEMNRAMGLHDLVPEVFVPPVVAEMQFVHDLIRAAAGMPASAGRADKKSTPICCQTAMPDQGARSGCRMRESASASSWKRSVFGFHLSGRSSW